MKRTVVVPIDALVGIVKDYTRDTHDIPDDAQPVSLQLKPTERGLFGIVIESPQFKDDAPIKVNFDIKRIYTV